MYFNSLMRICQINLKTLRPRNISLEAALHPLFLHLLAVPPHNFRGGTAAYSSYNLKNDRLGGRIGSSSLSTITCTLYPQLARFRKSSSVPQGISITGTENRRSTRTRLLSIIAKICASLKMSSIPFTIPRIAHL